MLVHQFSSVSCHCKSAEEAKAHIWMGVNEGRKRESVRARVTESKRARKTERKKGREKSTGRKGEI